MKSIPRSLAATAVFALASASAMAQSTTFQNGSFESGLTNWSTDGDVLVTTSGRKIGILSTASLDYEDDAPLGAGFNNNSGTAAVDFSFNNNLAGVPVGSLDIGGFAYEGSALRQSFMATAGQQITVKFDWAFLSSDTANADFGFIAINDTVVSFVNTASSPLVSSFTGNFGDFSSASWVFTENSYTYTAASDGAVSLVIGVADIGDYLGTSELRIDNVSVSAVPEPETYALMLAGLGLMGGYIRRRQKKGGVTAV